MALIDIEYGSLASSDTMNKNFMYLDEKIADTSDSIMTSISSILSNIATINSRINEISEKMSDSVTNLQAKLEDYKTKTKNLVNTATMVPNWRNCASISLNVGAKYTAPSNGYILLAPETISEGNLTVNGKTIVYKTINGQYDNGSQLVVFPVYNGDVVSSTVEYLNAYFVPAKQVSISNF